MKKVDCDTLFFVLFRSGSRSGSVRISAPDDDGIDSEEDENRK